uniref:SDR family oxidoreductase n=1 Tax=Allorhizocola rhizosphaerae TaxID=1872709 RepID=UPI000E3EBF98
VGLIARGAAGLEAARRECETNGAERVATAQCDVADADAVFAAARALEAELGPPDVWINNAMVSVFAPTWEITPREHARVMGVNYLGTVHGTLAALESMRVRGRGRIVQVGSVLAYRGIPFQSAYCASKHAIQGFVDSLRPELLREHPGITVGMVQLPAVNTPQFSWVRTRLPRHPKPMGDKIFTPGAVAEAIVWAADHRVREVTVGGQAIKARIANAIAPGWLDHKLAAEGYEGQQTGESIDPGRWRDNVDAPLDNERDYGTDGEFGEEAETRVVLKAGR